MARPGSVHQLAVRALALDVQRLFDFPCTPFLLIVSAEVIDYEQKWGARKIKESLHIKSERADCQLMNRDGGLAISAIWQQAL